MTRFHSDGDTLASVDPFDGTELERRIVITPVKEEKYPPGRAIAAAYWISYFTLHWLTILKVVEPTVTIAGTTIYFLVAAIIVTMMTAAHDAMEKKK